MDTMTVEDTTPVETKIAAYAHPERLVTTEWLAEQIEGRRIGGPDGIALLESDEDVLLYDTGHIPGALKIDWHLDLNDPVSRDYVDGARFAEVMGSRGIVTRHESRHLRRQVELVGGVRAVGAQPVRTRRRPAA